MYMLALICCVWACCLRAVCISKDLQCFVFCGTEGIGIGLIFTYERSVVANEEYASLWLRPLLCFQLSQYV